MTEPLTMRELSILDSRVAAARAVELGYVTTREAYFTFLYSERRKAVERRINLLRNGVYG